MSMKYGKISLIIGPMFSGKSTELAKRINKYTIKKKKAVLVRYNLDTRYTSEEEMVTHDGIRHPAISASKLKEIKAKLDEYEVIGLDEGQFFEDVIN